jgi:hypothetical protein
VILLQMEHTISFTKNGVNLGVAFRDVKGDFLEVYICLLFVIFHRSLDLPSKVV